MFLPQQRIPTWKLQQQMWEEQDVDGGQGEDRVKTGDHKDPPGSVWGPQGSWGRSWKSLEGRSGASAPVFVPSDPGPGGSDLLLSFGRVLFLLLQEVSQVEDELSLSFWELMRI